MQSHHNNILPPEGRTCLRISPDSRGIPYFGTSQWALSEWSASSGSGKSLPASEFFLLCVETSVSS